MQVISVLIGSKSDLLTKKIELRTTDCRVQLDAVIDALYDTIASEGLDTVFSSFFTTTERFLDLPRKYELKSVINRRREITFQAGDVQ